VFIATVIAGAEDGTWQAVAAMYCESWIIGQSTGLQSAQCYHWSCNNWRALWSGQPTKPCLDVVKTSHWWEKAKKTAISVKIWMW